MPQIGPRHELDVHRAGLQFEHNDLVLVGFDDMDESRAFWPPLTTVRQNFREVGRIAMERLLAQIDDPDAPPQTTLIPTELVVRESSGPPPAR